MAMDHKAEILIALVVAATMLISGCAIEVPKSALREFRLTPPEEPANAVKSETKKPVPHLVDELKRPDRGRGVVTVLASNSPTARSQRLVANATASKW